MGRGLTLVLILAAAALAAGGARRPVVYTTFYPTTWFAERIGGERVSVVCPVPEGEDPIFWKPARETIQAYQRADLVLVNGASFERWVFQVSLPRATLVDTARPLRGELLVYESSTEHSHGREGAHSHTGVDGHTWLDPQNAKVQAGEIHQAFVRLLPERAEELGQRCAALAADLDGLDQSLRQLAVRIGQESLYASHPAYNYLARRYGLSVVSLDLDPEEMPGPEALAEIAARLAAAPARILLWEAAPLPEISARLRADLGLESVEFSPCELLGAEARRAGEDYLTVMRRNVANLAAALARNGK